ncbi:YbfB/YjiJ family MFS transporter [Paenisporosarcina cavernae]|uniref:YbfB/YjiJ family MFS transporter n=1 Tax=Paenisporosarcina cavernae TaxID=2320858 RepID=A0A385YY65_9BACL|nr:YbfB/YjiJ family MFS transporter [Paenisporosarcina cavernae]AYC30473.1 YbfB/YjiJ family MFS transporter [Paenisporosarcina cavernae]
MNKPLLLVIGGVFSLFIAMSIGRFAYTPILPFMQEEKEFSTIFAGYLASSNYAGYLVGAIIGSLFPIQQNRSLLLRISIAVSIGLTIAMGLTDHTALWVVFRFVSGVASAFVFVLTSSIVLDQLAAKGKMGLVGVMYGGVGLGIFVSSLLVPFLVTTYGSDGTWIGLGILALIVSTIVFLFVNEDRSLPAISQKTTKKKKPSVKKWLPWLLIAYGLEGLGYIVTGTFIVAIAEQTPIFHGNGTSVWLLVGLAAIPSCVVWAYYGNRFGWMTSFFVLLLIQSIGIALPAFSSSIVSFYISALLFGATFMGVTTLVAAYARGKLPHASARILAILTITYALGQMVGPSIAGIVTDASGDYHLALYGAAIAVFLGALFVIPLMAQEREEKSAASESNV